MALPSKFTSYFAAGLPIIAATDEGSITAEELDTAEAGIRVDAYRPDLLVQAAMDLRRNPQKAHALGNKGLKFRRLHLNADSSLDSFHGLLTELAANSSGSRDSLKEDELQWKRSKLV
jgi:colanic acid biosynthesis glycosyl transferase WcaI